MAGSTVAVIPVRSLEGAKSRLGDVLDAEERRDLVARLLERTVGAARDAAIERVLVVTADAETAALAELLGAEVVIQQRPGLNAALGEGREAATAAGGAGRLVVLPADLPLVDAAALRALLAPAERAPTDRVVVLVPDRHGHGTNALVLQPPDVIPFAFGRASRAAHTQLAASAGARYVELESPLSTDLDTADDLLLVERHVVAPGEVASDDVA